MGVFLRLHEISQEINWFHVVFAFILGMSFQAVGTDYIQGNITSIPMIEESFNSSSLLKENSLNKASLRELALNPSEFKGENVTVTGQKAVGDVLRTEKGANIAFDCSKYSDAIALTMGETYTMTGEIRSKQEYSGYDLETGEVTYKKEYYLYCTEPPR